MTAFQRIHLRDGEPDRRIGRNEPADADCCKAVDLSDGQGLQMRRGVRDRHVRSARRGHRNAGAFQRRGLSHGERTVGVASGDVRYMQGAEAGDLRRRQRLNVRRRVDDRVVAATRWRQA